MDASNPCGNDSFGPPRAGYAGEYERLLIEELSLREAQNNYLERSKKSNTSNDEQVSTADELKIRAMVLRASFEGMLLTAQHASDEASSKNIDVNEKATYERGLEQPDAKVALVALSRMKSRQLEELDNRIPISIDEDALAWRRRRYASTADEGETCVRKSAMPMEASVDDFFTTFPECKRRDTTLLYPEMDDSDSEDESIDEIIPEAKKKQKIEEDKQLKSSSTLQRQYRAQPSSPSIYPKNQFSWQSIVGPQIFDDECDREWKRSIEEKGYDDDVARDDDRPDQYRDDE